MLDVADLIGTPFSKMPCWELAKEYYRRQGIELQEYYKIDCRNTDNITGYTKLKEPEKGCICAFSLSGNGIDHVGIYLGDNQLLHSTKFSGVCIERLSKYIPRMKGAYRYDPCNNRDKSI